MRAPIECNGSITRCMGRLDNDASPANVESNDCPASSPANSRIAVPALPQSSGDCGALRPSIPTPCTIRTEGSGISTRTPMAAKAAAVARVSAPSRNPSIRDVPSAIAASMTARCEIDLSPGTVRQPFSGVPGPAIQSCVDSTVTLGAGRTIAASAVSLLEVVHEDTQRLDTGLGQRVIDRCAHAAQGTMTLERNQARLRRFLQERLVERGVVQEERNVHPRPCRRV